MCEGFRFLLFNSVESTARICFSNHSLLAISPRTRDFPTAAILNPQTLDMLLKYLALVVALLAISVLAGKKENSENIVISDDAVVLSSGGKKHNNNIVIKDEKKKKCSCHVEVEHWGWQHWQPHNSWGWGHKKKHDHWKRK